MKIKSSIFALISSVFFGLMLATSIGFHIDLLQELTFSNKLICITLLSIPLIWLFFFLLNRVMAKANRGHLLLPLTISLLGTSLLMVFAYRGIEPVQIHTFQLHIPEQTESGSSVSLMKVYSQDIFNKDIPIESFEFAGSVNHPKKGGIMLLSGSTTNLKRVFSGTLHLVLETTGCPLKAEVLIDETQMSVNLCELNADGEVVINVSTNGVVPAKWELLRKLFYAIDALIIFVLLIGISHFMIYRSKYQKNELEDDYKNQLVFFFIALFSTCFSIVMIFWKRVPDLEVFFPIVVLLAGYQIHVLFNNTKWNKLIDCSLIITVFASGLLVNLWLERTTYFSSLNTNMIKLKSDPTGSYDAMVDTIYRNLSDSIYYGYGSLVFGRTIITSQDIADTAKLDEDKFYKLQVELQIQSEISYSLKEDDFECLMTKSLSKWHTRDITLYVLDKNYFQDAEPIILGEFQDVYVLFPNSFVFEDGFCK